MFLTAVLLLTMVLTLVEVFIFVCTMTHQEYNSLPTTQTTNRVTQNCWNYLTCTY